MRHILLPEAAKAASQGLVRLDDEKLKHLRRVLRMDWNEIVHVTDGAGRLFQGTLEQQGSSGAIRLDDLVSTESAGYGVELAIGLPKNATMDWLVEKAVECGVSTITPVVTSRSVVKPSKGDEGKYVRRWQTIMDGAVEQSERLWRPLVCEPTPWPEFLSGSRGTKSFAFVSELRQSLASDSEAMTHLWQELTAARGEPIRILIGPEGGFADSEREEMARHGFISLSLGSTVLRVETAVIAALSLVRATRLVSLS